MFEQIWEAHEARFEENRRQIVIKHIKRLMGEGYIFVADQITDDVDYLCANANSDELIKLFDMLLDLKVECKGTLESLAKLPIDPFKEFENFMKDRGQKKVVSKTHEMIEALSKSNSKLDSKKDSKSKSKTENKTAKKESPKKEEKQKSKKSNK